jgi:hypothetical protein
MTTETPQPATRPASGGTALLVTISAATILTVSAEAAFIHWAAWALLPLIALAIVLVAAGVVAAVGRLIDDGEIATPSRAATPAEQPAPAPAPQRATRPVLGH